MSYYGKLAGNSIRHGNGTLEFPNMDKFEGEFIDGMREGFGTFSSQKGERIYVGYWKSSLKHGHGRETWKVGEYEGSWEKNLYHGNGRLKTPRGVYEGEFRNGYKSGKGKMSWISKGQTYVGDWKEGKMHGFGRIECENGTVYEGDFRNGMKNGEGWEQKKSGERYEGQWKDNLHHGSGLMRLDNGKYRWCESSEGIRTKWMSDEVLLAKWKTLKKSTSLV
eukprot:TRINITY_DN782100_c0_g1_i1.p1 TRINITY_DN782100_c0_g1~~TRINITY_DN782100_c0_g1_i1.p1  ORF type:complete len:221 (+),score=27.86 TRINITY_DN782100_c0_g1_i1:145-807(+)